MTERNVLLMHWGRNGGGPRFLWELAREFRKQPGVQVHLSYSEYSRIRTRFEQLDLPSVSVPTYRSAVSFVLGLSRLLRAVLRTIRYVDRNQIDVVIGVMESPWQVPVAAFLKWRRVPYLLCVHDATMHPGDSNAIEGRLRLLERGLAAGLVTFSEHVQRAVSGQRSSRGKAVKRTVHPAFSETSRGEPRSPRSLPRDGTAVVGFFGRISKYKGIDIAINAHEVLADRGIASTLRIVGSGELDVKTMSPDIEIQNEWIPEEDIESILSDFDVLILPYREASQSGVISFAWSLGIPVVATPVGGLVEQARVSGAALLSSDTSAEALADALDRVLSDRTLYSALSQAGLSASRGSHSWTRAAKDMLEFITELDTSPPRRTRQNA